MGEREKGGNRLAEFFEILRPRPRRRDSSESTNERRRPRVRAKAIALMEGVNGSKHGPR